MMNNQRSRAAMISVFVLGLIIFAVVYYGWVTMTDIFQPPKNAQTKPIQVEIKPNESANQIADDLYHKGIIRNPTAFKVWARVKGLDANLHAGIYTNIRSDMNISDLIDELQKQAPDQVTVSIPEGLRIEQIAYRFANAEPVLTKFDRKQFLDYAKHPKKFPDYDKYSFLKDIPDGNSMEGFLFPDTYNVAIDGDTKSVINQMLSEFKTMADKNTLFDKAKAHNMKLYEYVTLASIVEREARFDEDRANTASIYWNRTYNSIPETAGFLNADPTIQYGRDSENPPASAKDYWKPLENAASNVVPKSPYNSYITKGLPPSPICNPGLKSLSAMATPPDTGYYFFINKADGHAVFAKTLAEQEANQQKYNIK